MRAIGRNAAMRVTITLLGAAVVAVIALTVAMQRPYVMRIAPASATFDHASIGWQAGERSAAGVSFRWTLDESTLTFRGARRALPANRRLMLGMTFSGRPPGSPVAMVTLMANGQTIDRWSSDVEHRVAVDVAPLLRRDDELRLTLNTETFSPPRDRRELGVALIDDARIEAWPGRPIPAPDAAASVALLGALAALAMGRRAAPRLRLVAAGAMGIAIFLGVLLARGWFWRAALPLELTLGAIVAARWTPEWWAALSWPVRAAHRRLGLNARWLVLGGGATAVAGQSVIALHRWTPAGVGLLAVGLVVMLVGLTPSPRTADAIRVGEAGERRDAALSPSPDRMRVGRWQIVALVAIAAVAGGLRLALLTEMPASLFRDEARHALAAMRILDDPSYRPIYEPDIALPALFLYPLALWFKAFGFSLLTLRLFMAAVGVADVLLLFALGRRLFGARVGLIAAFLFAASFWALRMQRVALIPAFSTGLVLLALWLFARAVQLRRWRDWVIAGIGAAGTVYAYHSAPFALVLMAGVAVAFLWRSPRRFVRVWLPRFALFAAIFLVLAAPLVRYIATHFAEYSARPKQTAIFSEQNLHRLGQDQLAALEANVGPNLGMYTVQGDREAKHNLPFAPNLDALTAVLFLLGLGLAASGWLARSPYAVPPFGRRFVVGYLAALMIPSLLAIDAPNTLRAFDTAPPALLLAALGAEAVWVRMISGTSTRVVARDRQAGAVLATIALGTILALNTGTYFWRMRTDQRETLRFDTYFASQAGKRIAGSAGGSAPVVFFVPRAEIDRDVFPFFLRVANGAATVRPLEEVNGADLPARFVILLPNGALSPSPDTIIAGLSWARDLQRVPGKSPAGARGVPAFIEYRAW